MRFSEHLAEAGIPASVGSVGDSFDNALAETIDGLYKTELIKHRGPWRTVEQVEYATAEWVDWFNHRRLYEYCGDVPPAELENAYYRQTQSRVSHTSRWFSEWNPSYGLGGRVFHDAAVLDDEEMAAPTGPSLASARLDCGGRERGAI